MFGIGVIGYGYWGPNLVRNFSEMAEAKIVAVADASADRRALARRRHPQLDTFGDPFELLARTDVDAVAVATPVASHYQLAMAALQAGKHVLVEKPMAATSEQAQTLMEESCRRRLVLMVDHTFVYTGAVRKIREIIDSGSFGELYYYDSVRINLGLFQQDVDVTWDLAIHDLTILDYLVRERPCSISTVGKSHLADCLENVAYLTLNYESRFIAHIVVNWLAPVKIRQIHIGGSERMIVYDDVQPSEKVKVYDRGVTVDNHLTPDKVKSLRVGYRTGDIWVPEIDRTEALRRVTDEFVNCINRGAMPLTGGAAGLRIIRTLEAARRSMNNGGRPVELERTVAA